MSQATNLATRIAQLTTEIARSQAELDAAVRSGANPLIISNLQETIARQQQVLTGLRLQLQQVQRDDALGTASAGEVVTQEAQARTDGAVASNPVTPPSVLSPNGRINPQNIETGTNEPVRSQEQLQSTPPAGNGSALPFDGSTPPSVSLQGGAAAPRDDNTTPNNNTTAQIINSSFNQRIVPKPNVLDEYASYTYSLTWYLLTPNQYNELLRSKKKNCATWQLLMQSGGAPTQAAGATANDPAVAGRNQFFDKDYYMDDLEIDSVILGKGTNAANNALDIKFKVLEPNGITLVENLYKAVSTLYKQNNVSKTSNYPTAQYCMAVRFYGYNELGELVTTGRRGTNGQNNLTDPRAIVEKFYPFVITNIKFRIPKDRVVEYQVEAKPIPHFYNKSQDRGTIPFNFELIGETVEQILQGKPVGTVYPASQGERIDSPQPNTSAPTNPAASVNDISTSAGLNEFGNFTGETQSPFQAGP